jgi:hypothetical protein
MCPSLAELATNPADMTDVAADGPAMGRTSRHETRTCQCCGNIRNIAKDLDVFTLIRSKASWSQEVPKLQTKVYMN